MTEPISTTCPYCGVGCGIRATVAKGAVEISGDPSHPANFGRLCSKGSALGETTDLEGRLLYPEIAGQRVGWDRALDLVADRFGELIAAHGPDSVAFYVSGQLLTEDYYVANKLMKGFIGSGNIDTNSRLCMSSSVAGHKRAFGSDTVPNAYADFEQASLIILTGSNAAWCHPVLYQRIVAARAENGTRVVVIDPRRTQSCDIADLHLPLRSGTDAHLFNGLLAWLHAEGCMDAAFVDNHTEGLADALAQADADIPAIARACGLRAGDVRRFFELFRDHPQTLTLYSQGINQSSSGTDKVNAILNCHLLTGRIGKPGCGPFSLTGQPNAMGGREVGGLANQLAAHMEFANPEHGDRVGRFWQTDKLATRPGLRAVELFDAVAAGQVKAVWIMATNPAVSLPNADAVRAALGGDVFVVVSDCVRHTDTTQYADVLLPALAWGEKDGTVTNSERRISRQRAFLPAPGEARADWDIIADVARRMGFGAAFDYKAAVDIFREHAALSAFENDGSRDFDLSGLCDIDAQDYDGLQPVQWPVLADRAAGSGADAYGGTERLFADGRFYTPSGKAQFIAVSPRGPRYTPDGVFPLTLNTGRVRDHWHSLTRTGKSPRLSQHTVEPFVAIHPMDARRFQLENGALAQVETGWGRMIARVTVTNDQRPGDIFVPFHWNDQFAAKGRADALVAPVTDPVSGQPESKATPARVTPFAPQWHGFLLSSAPVPGSLKQVDYWVQANGAAFSRYELAGLREPQDWEGWARDLMATDVRDEWISYCDSARKQYRFARIADERLVACLFVSPDHHLPARAWLSGLFSQPVLPAEARRDLLAGRSISGQDDTGPTVCSCFGVGQFAIEKAIRERDLTSAGEVGDCLQAGTNCGSCVPEINALIKSAHRDFDNQQATENVA